MKLCDCEVAAAHSGAGIYQYKNKKFNRWIVRFDVQSYCVERTYLYDCQIVDDFEQNNSEYMNLMAMLQSDEWELIKQ